MNYNIKSGKRSGSVCIPSSKSLAHRFLICSALSRKSSSVICDGISKDIDATIKCLCALGAQIKKDKNNILSVSPIDLSDTSVGQLYCAESGSTLRFLIPVVGALGKTAVFHMEGRLSQRPLDALIKTLSENGMTIRQENDLLYCSGRLSSGYYHIPGDISSQFISGMLFALPLLEGDSTLEIIGKTESADYIKMTENAIKNYGVTFRKENSKYIISGKQTYSAPEKAYVERDWSNAAFFVCMGAFSEKGITLSDMSLESAQGDMEILNIVENFGAQIQTDGNCVTVKKGKLRAQTVDACSIPDLIPVIGVLASAAEGITTIINAQRLRLTESDRLKTTAQMLDSLGADVEETQDGLIIKGKEYLCGGTADASNDHRIAMSAAVAACICKNDVIVEGAQCVAKSYPDFWKHFEKLEVSQ